MIMYKYIVFFFILFVSCMNHPKEYAKFTKEQIDSLCLDSTKILEVDIKSATVVDLNPYLERQSFDFGKYVQDVKFVQLETTDESLLGNIYKIIITDSLNYIMDDFKGSGIVIFNKKGKFIRRIPHGEGPGELYKLYDISFDKTRNELVAYQHPFLLFYTAEGKYIRQTKLPIGFYNFLVTPDGYVFKTLDKSGNEHLGDKKANTLLVTDKNFKLKYASLPSPLGKVSYGGYRYLYENNNAIQVTQNYTDTIYHYIADFNKLEVAYIMDYHSKRLPDQYLQYERKKFNKVLSQNNYYYYIGEYLETKFQHVFFLRNNYIGLQTIVYRDKRTGKMIGGTNADFDVNELPAIAFPKAAYGNYFISLHYPSNDDNLLSNSSIISDEDKQIILNMKEDDNPCLVFYQLKEI